MAEETTKDGATGTGGGDASDKAAAAGATLASAPRIKLAHDDGGAERDPATVFGEVNIPGHPPIYLPGNDEQRKGFTPLYVATINGRPTHKRYKGSRARLNLIEGVETAAGLKVALDADSAPAAVRAVLTQFTGVYKPVEEKGA